MAVKYFQGIVFFLFPLILSAQIDSVQYRQSFYKTPIITGLVAPTILTAIGLFTLKQDGFFNKNDIQKFLHQNIGTTHTNIDDYLAFTPMVSNTGLSWSGVKPKNDLYNRSLLYIKSELLMIGIVYGLKYAFLEMRPDSSDNLSFPSGQTAQAFLSATIMHKEFKDRSPWYSIAGFSTASIVGILRILNNKQWVPDILIGAATGILSGNIVYLTHRHRIWPKRWGSKYIYPYSRGKYTGIGLLWDL